MTKLALEHLMKSSLENHIYSFNGKIMLQSSGGGMGDPLTGAIASVFVINWSRQFKQKLSDLGIPPPHYYLKFSLMMRTWSPNLSLLEKE